MHEGGVYGADIHHIPWKLQAAEATITRNTMAEAAGINLPAEKPLLHFSKRIEVLVWPISPVVILGHLHRFVQPQHLLIKDEPALHVRGEQEVLFGMLVAVAS